MADLIQEEMDKKQFSFFKRKIKKRPVTGVIPPLIEWAETFRYLPTGDTEYAGKFSSSVTPHLIEPLEMLHPDCEKTHVSIMKSVQAAVTTAVGENALGALIYHKYGTCGMFTATQDLAETRSKTTIATMIKRAGLVFESISDNATGETTLHKQFAGNINLFLAGYLSIGKMKSNPMKFIFKDEIDEMPAEIRGQGDTNKVIEGRVQGKRRFKILNVSTPSDMRTSRIYKEFLMGDQRIFHAPCPLCGEKQELVLKRSGEKHGLTFTMKKNEDGKKELIPSSVRYICKYCHGEFKESKKQEMLTKGEWIPTATPKDRNRVSYHVSGLMSPEFALSWEQVCQNFINCDFGQDVLMFKDFTINMLGKPWAATTKTPKWQELKDRAEDYCMEYPPEGELRNYGGYSFPHAPLILYGGCDVQGDRLELHVVGFGADKEKWGRIDYKIFYGKTENLDDPCWLALEDYVYNHTYKICGIDCNITRCGIDSGYDPRKQKRGKDFTNKASIVYDFVAPRTDRFTAIMGVPTEKAMGIIKEAKINDVRTFLTKRYNIYVSLVKEMIMQVIEQTEGVGTIHYPKYQMVGGIKRVLTDEVYKRFLSERYQEDPKKPGNWIWFKIHQRNEDLDTFIYAVAMAEFDGVLNWSYENWNNYYESLIG